MDFNFLSRYSNEVKSHKLSFLSTNYLLLLASLNLATIFTVIGQLTSSVNNQQLLPTNQSNSSTSFEKQGLIFPAPVNSLQQQQFIPPKTQISTTTVQNLAESLTIVDYTNLAATILNSRTANLVYFNANFNKCKNCAAVYEKWRELANDIKPWQQIIRLFVINCSEGDNLNACKQAGATQFPQVKFYWIDSSSLVSDGERLIIIGKSVFAMRRLITDKLLEAHAKHQKKLTQKYASSSKNPSMSQNPLSLCAQLLNSSSFSGLADMTNTGKQAGINPMMSLANALLSIKKAQDELKLRPLPNNWPDIEPIETNDVNQLLNMLPFDNSSDSHALLVMETSEFPHNGPEVLFDLLPYSSVTYVARITDETGSLVRNLTKLPQASAPALVYVNKNHESTLVAQAPKYAFDDDLRRGFVKAFESNYVKMPIHRHWLQPNAAMSSNSGARGKHSDDFNKKISKDDEKTLEKANELYMADLINTINLSLTQQVYRHAILSDEQHSALTKYVFVLMTYFPFEKKKELEFVTKLHSWLQNKASPFETKSYKKYMKDENVKKNLKLEKWVSCRQLNENSFKSTENNNKDSKLSIDSFLQDQSQLGKMLANITKLFRDNQQQIDKLNSIFSMSSASGVQKVPVGGSQSPQSSSSSPSKNPSSSLNSTAQETISKQQSVPSSSAGLEGSPFESIFNELKTGSLGSDASILRYVSAALNSRKSGSSSSDHFSKFDRQYPCGMWKLSHVLVSSEYNKDSVRKEVRHIVMNSLSNYIINFYACHNCGNRVRDISGEFKFYLDDQLKSQADSVLFLWKIHNRINSRLEYEYRPNAPLKHQFPDDNLCPKCKFSTKQSQGQSVTNFDYFTTQNWDEDKILSFLNHFYRQKAIKTSSDDD